MALLVGCNQDEASGGGTVVIVDPAGDLVDKAVSRQALVALVVSVRTMRPVVEVVQAVLVVVRPMQQAVLVVLRKLVKAVRAVRPAAVRTMAAVARTRRLVVRPTTLYLFEKVLKKMTPGLFVMLHLAASW